MTRAPQGLCSSSVDPGEEGGLQLDANGKPVFKQTMKQKKQVEVDVFPEESWCGECYRVTRERCDGRPL